MTGHRYEVSVQTPAAAAGAAYATIRAAASQRARITEIGCFVNAGTATNIALIRPTNTFVPTTSVAVLPQDPSDGTGVTNVDTAWSTAPTIGSVFMRRIALPAVVGAGIVWQFENLVVGPAGTAALVLWNFGAAAGSVVNLYVVTDGIAG